MIRILITGSKGQLGKSIKKIASDYHEFHFVYKDAHELDIVNTNKIYDIFSKGKFDYCINCAAYTDVDGAEQKPDKAFLVNAEGVKNLALACHKNNVVLAHISTDYVFDGNKETPYKTTDKTNPINVYGASKLKGEIYIQEILEHYFVVRTSWLYSEFGKNFYKTILQKAKTEKVLRVLDDQTGCPTHAENLAKYILELILAKIKNYGIHHFTDGEPMTWYGFAKKILKENGTVQHVVLEKAKNYTTFAARPVFSVLG